jgi:hypothetical protein
MNQYIAIANLALTVLLLPLLAMQWRTRVELATATATILALSGKIDTADAEIKQLRQRMHDALNYISEMKAILNMRKTERK